MIEQQPSAYAVSGGGRREFSPSTLARIIAGLYLFVVGCGIVGQSVIADRFIDSGDATRTAAEIIANKSFYRLAFTLFMFEMAAQLAMTVLYYRLLKPVSRSVAGISAVMGLVGSGIKAFARLFYYVPLILLSGAVYLSPVEPDALAALSLASLKIGSQGAAIGLVFFGFEDVLRGWLIYRSEFLPRFLGVLSLIGGLGWLTFAWPPLGYSAFMFVALFALVGVVLTTGWLLIRGVDDAKWIERARLAAMSLS